MTRIVVEAKRPMGEAGGFVDRALNKEAGALVPEKVQGRRISRVIWKEIHNGIAHLLLNE